MKPPPAKGRSNQQMLSFSVAAVRRTLPPPEPAISDVDADEIPGAATTASQIAVPPGTTVTGKSTPTKKKPGPRLYQDNYMQYGFTVTVDPTDSTLKVPLCVICGDTLANSAMVPSKMKRHLEKHTEESDKDIDYFVSLKAGKDEELKKQQALLSRFTKDKVSEKALEASYKIAELMAKL